MPPLEQHLISSKERHGDEHRKVHEWLDLDPETKAERHDPTRVHKHSRRIAAEHGAEARDEFLHHIREDIMGDLEKRDVPLLREAGLSAADIAHCLGVADRALEMAGRSGAAIDMEFVARAALFHDLGKAVTHEIEHGMIGAELGERLGLPPAITAVMEKHIRGGLTGPEAAELGLPPKDYSLHLLEERIIIYADRLVDVITESVVDLGGEESEAERRFEEILRRYQRYGKNEPTLERYLRYHAEIQGLIARTSADIAAIVPQTDAGR